MEIIARFTGCHGEVSVLEEIATGARYYREGDVLQSYVLPKGRAGLAYVRLMAALLGSSRRVLLLGCGGGALATELHKAGRMVTVVDNNPISFQIAREYFWMPRSVRCVTADMLQFFSTNLDRYPGIGVDVGGPRFDYDEVLNASLCAQLAEHLESEGRMAINIVNDFGADIELIAARLAEAGLDVALLDEGGAPDRNIVLLCMRDLKPEVLRDPSFATLQVSMFLSSGH